MLKPSTERLDYSELLSPPPGFVTEYAVGTTYSLDMDALIGVSLALGLSESIDGELFDTPVCLLNALTKTADKLVLFAQGGQIQVPASAGPLHSLLDKMVFEVTLRKKRSFHPKLWLVKYAGTGHEQGHTHYRLLILSRNLTFDRSWDVAVCLEGKPHKKAQEKNYPLQDFFRFLLSWLKTGDKNAAEKRKILHAAIREIPNICFELGNTRFSDFSFCPVGVADSSNNTYSMDSSTLFEKHDELFVISPFLSASGNGKNRNPIDLLNASGRPNSDKTLITRRSELPKLSDKVLEDFNVYVMRDIVIDGEETLSEGKEDESPKQQDIHAKLYLRTRNSDSELFIGSPNASSSAFFLGNVEFALKITGKRRYLNVNTLKKDLFGEDEKDNPFEKIDAANIARYEGEPSSDLEAVIRQICLSGGKAQVCAEDDKYDIHLSINKLPPDCDAVVSPLLWEKSEPLQESVVFKGLPLERLCEFYKITVQDEKEKISRVIRINTEGIPAQRDAAIVKNILKNQQGFIMYVSMILGENYYLSLLETRKLSGKGYLFSEGQPIPALYEKMLKAAATSPDKLREIGRLLDMISDEDIIPEGFIELYETFKKAVRIS
jgi:hypothetical protein